MTGMQGGRGDLVVKVDLDGDIRRLRGWPVNGEAPTFDALCRDIGELYCSPADGMRLSYRDDEGDVCALSEATLPDALELSQRAGRGVLKLMALRMPPAAAAAQSGADPMAMETAATPWPLEQEPPLPDDGRDEPVEQVGDLLRQPEQQPQAQQPEAEQPEDAGTRPTKSNFKRFTEQVQEDFCTARDDMLRALSPPAAAGGASREDRDDSCHAGAAAASKGVVAAVAGLAVSMRFVPLRATRLAAESIAAAVSSQDATSSPGVADSPGMSPIRRPDDAGDGSAHPEEQLPSTASAPSGSAGLDEDMQHFKQQVMQDFETARQEYREAIGCFIRPPAEQPPGDSANERPGLKQAVATVAPMVIGSVVAAELVPMRAMRLGVAALARSAPWRRPEDGGEDRHDDSSSTSDGHLF